MQIKAPKLFRVFIIEGFVAGLNKKSTVGKEFKNT